MTGKGFVIHVEWAFHESLLSSQGRETVIRFQLGHNRVDCWHQGGRGATVALPFIYSMMGAGIIL